MPYDGEPVALDTLARESAARLERPAELAEVCVVCETEEVEIPGNSLIIEEIIYNLIDNAIKYNRAGGKVTIKVFYDKDEAVLSVEDNGIGIPSDKQDRVFERFFRVDKSHSRSIGGTGLGLSIVKHSAAYHNAKISLRSTEGVGTAVEVRFPLKNNYSKERQ
jgi:two-component system phosphate regulon sensor histidine kinase PhoR